MKRRKKLLIWLLGTTGVVLALMVALPILASRYINSEWMKARIGAEVKQLTGGSVEYGKVDLSLLPLPHIEIHQGSIAIPSMVEGTFQYLSLYPKIISLFGGKVRFREVDLSGPDLRVTLPKDAKKEKREEKEPGGVTFDERVTNLLTSLTQLAPGLSAKVKKGNLDIYREKEFLFSFKELRGNFGLPPGELTIDFASRSNLWERVTFKGRLDPKDLKGKGEIYLSDFRPQVLTNLFFSRSPLEVEESQVNLHMKVTTDGPNNVQADVSGSIPSLALSKGKKKVVIKAGRLDGAFRMDEGGISGTLSGLDLAYPPLNLTGKFVNDRASSVVRAEIRGENVDVDALRKTSLALAGDVSLVQDIFKFVKGGRVPRITVQSQGKTMEELGKTESFRIEGSITEGKIYVPGPGLDLFDVRGNAVIAKATLYGKNCQGRYKRSRGRDGTLTVGLKGKGAPLHLDIEVEADLSELPPVLARLVKNEKFRKELSLLKDVAGSARGKLILGETTKSVNATVDVSQFNISTRYGRVPYPIKVVGGRFYFDEEEIRVRGLRGTVGKSSFKELTGRLIQKKEPIIEISSWKPVLSLDEMYAWLSIFEDLATVFTDFKPRQGTVALSSTRIEGPLRNPKDWRFEATGKMRDVVMDLTIFESPLTLKSGKIRTDHDKLSFTDARGTVRDASFIASGTLDGYMEKVHKADLTFSGKLGLEATNWFSDLVNLPKELRVRPPLSISGAHLVSERDSKISFSGNFALESGTSARLDIVYSPEKLVIKDLIIEDQESHFAHTLVLGDEYLEFTIKGNLTPATLNGLFLNNLFPEGRIKGDFRAKIMLDQLTGSEAFGRFVVKNLIFPIKLEEQLLVREISLEAAKNEFRVNSGELTWGDMDISLAGSAVTSGESVTLDMDLFTERLKWANLKNALESDENSDEVKEETEELDTGAEWNHPMRGVLRFKTGAFEMGDYTWSPFQADITFSRNSVNVSIKEGVLCGVSTPGVLGVSQQVITLDFYPSALNQELGPTYACFFGKEGAATGTFDLKGNVNGSGKGDDLVRSLNGNLDFSASTGRIYEGGTVAKIINFLNVTEVYRGVFPSMKDGIDYKSITFKGEFKDGRLTMKESVIDGTSMEIAAVGDINYLDKQYDLKVLVSPLKTVDSIVKLIPLVGDIVGGTLITVPVKVTGDFNDPKVSYMPASAVGSGLLGILTNTLKAPVKLIDYAIPGKKEKEKEEEGEAKK